MNPWSEDLLKAEMDYRRGELRKMIGTAHVDRTRAGHRTGTLRKLLHRGHRD